VNNQRKVPRLECSATNLMPITYFGSAWATLGLARSIPAQPETPTR